MEEGTRPLKYRLMPPIRQRQRLEIRRQWLTARLPLNVQRRKLPLPPSGGGREETEL
jgi:hypothetical protein